MCVNILTRGKDISNTLREPSVAAGRIYESIFYSSFYSENDWKSFKTDPWIEGIIMLKEI